MNYNFLVDSHCHLDLIEKSGQNIDQIIENASQNQVKILQTICTKISDFSNIYKYAQKYDNVFASVGIHPCNVEEEPKITSDQITQLCKSNPKIIGIGETGLDYYHPGFVKKNQIYSFKQHIKAARQTGLPIIIHSRNADEDMIKILQEEKKLGEFKAVLHCFSSSKELALKAIDLGVYISISGIVTFKNATELQDIVKNLPLKYLIVETDAPYLAPTPYRGKLNQPSYTKNTAQFLANLKNASFEEICQITSENFFNLFDGAK
jgi:TatD DNase family protein